MSVVDGKLWKCDVVTCGHIWYSLGEKPKRCSRCKSPYWDKTATKMIIEPKAQEKLKAKPQPGISSEKCLKPEHLVFKNGDSWVCMTCKKEK